MIRLRINRLEWDDWNREHIARHHVVPHEAEAVLKARPFIKATYKERFLIVGPTQAGRVLSIVVGEVPDKPDVYYVFSARPASRKERQELNEARGE